MSCGRLHSPTYLDYNFVHGCYAAHIPLNVLVAPMFSDSCNRRMACLSNDRANRPPKGCGQICSHDDVLHKGIVAHGTTKQSPHALGSSGSRNHAKTIERHLPEFKNIYDSLSIDTAMTTVAAPALVSSQTQPWRACSTITTITRLAFQSLALSHLVFNFGAG